MIAKITEHNIKRKTVRTLYVSSFLGTSVLYTDNKNEAAQFTDPNILNNHREFIRKVDHARRRKTNQTYQDYSYWWMMNGNKLTMSIEEI